MCRPVGLAGNITGAQKPTKDKRMPRNSLDKAARGVRLIGNKNGMVQRFSELA